MCCLVVITKDLCIKREFYEMNALRIVYETPPATITVPEEFRHGSVEVIIMPLSQTSMMTYGAGAIRARSGLSDFAGSWKGSRLVREAQGAYEAREALR